MTLFVPDPVLLSSPRRRPFPGPDPRPRTGPPPATADVVVVGSGPAGLSVASALWHRDVRDVVLLDPADRPCGQFLDRVDGLDQRVLRSPYQHHPGVEGYRDCELLDFARLHWSRLTAVERREIRMAQAGHRSVVPVDVFEAFCRHVADVHHVTERTWRTTALAVEPADGSVVVRTAAGPVEARCVVLALGERTRPAPAGWGARTLPGVYRWDEPAPATGSVAVVGAGLTAAHLLAAALDAGREAHWVLREDAERYQCSDVNAAFFRAEGRARFGAEVSWADRGALMRRHRRASIMFEFRPLLTAAEASGQLRVHRGRTVDGLADGPAVLLAGGDRVAADSVVLALGTVPSIGTGLLPDGAVGARDGWPDLDEPTLSYRRAPAVFAVGAAAAMVLGPAARNIDGHRVATARVAGAIAARVRTPVGVGHV
ncbi:MAG TPA: FAD-dependent oxidoreductase [Mycobacteriales bacterium]|nr:FAD-dependent oxidoreductase [Mycobacteriales bacterium]